MATAGTFSDQAGAEIRRGLVDRARLRILERAPTATLKELLTATLDLAEELTGSQIGFFHFVDEDQTTLGLQAWSTNTVARMCTAQGAGQHYPLAQAGVWADCVRTGRPVVHNDYPSLPGRKGLPPGHAAVIREISVPVSRAGRICAVIGVGNKATAYQDQDVAELSALADLAWDVAARTRSEEAHRASEEQLRLQQERLGLAASAGKMGLWDLDLRTDVAWRTPEHDRLFGYDRLQPAWGKEICLRHVVEEDRPIFERAFQRALATGHFHYELRINPVGQPVRWIEASGEVFRDQAGTPVRMMGSVVDVTERVALREQLAVQSRLAALGTLVAGVAHEVNNPLVVEVANQAMALESLRGLRTSLLGRKAAGLEAELRSLDDAIEAIEDAQEGAVRIARIVKDLTTIGRPDARRERARVIAVVEEALGHLPDDLGTGRRIRVEDGGAPDVIANVGQLTQVVVNLVSNALRATPVERGDPVVVRTGPGPAGTARLDVIDRGAGIDPAILGRIFEPFFTTRAVGQGKGIGLAVSHAVVTAHGGTLTATSVPGQGTTFSIELPAAV